MLLFFVLQTFLFIPADWILFPDRFYEFLTARLAENALLAFLYFKWSYVDAVQSTAISSLTGAALFLFMVHVTGGVESGYYVGLILLLVGIAVLAPLTGRQSSLIAGTICLSYASLPWTSHLGSDVNWTTYVQHLFFLSSAAVEAGLACMLMDRMRFRDFCQRRELTEARDELAELDRVKSRFSANVHHELRTPLTLILSPLEALRSGDFGVVPTLMASTLDTMHSNGRRLHKMINNLLDLSKIENKQLKITRRPTRIDRLVCELISGAIPLAVRKEIEIKSTGFDNPIELAVDADAIENVLVNLLGNALKFTDAGGLIIVSGELEVGGLTIRVKDTGIGIPVEQLRSVFDRFAQVDSSTTRKYEGTGIGLSLAQEMVHLHDGRIWAESEGTGFGTTMNVWIPAIAGDSCIEEDVLADDSGRTLGARESIAAIEADLNIEFQCSEDNTEDLGDIRRQTKRLRDQRSDLPDDQTNPEAEVNATQDTIAEVLIAEDNPDMRQLLKILMGKYYRVRVARNGCEALALARTHKPDLILSDVMMPEMDGIELCREIKNGEETSSIPVILVTSKAEGEMKLEGLERGADDYVTKPFHPRELLARVRSLIRASVLRRELALKNTQLGETLEELQRAEVRLVQSERLAAVGELAAGIAHEVNNPVNFALNAARALAKTIKEMNSLSLAIADTDTDLEISDTVVSQQTGAHEELRALSIDILELGEIVSQGLERTQALVANLRNFGSPNEQNRAKTDVELESILRSAVNQMKPTFSQSKIVVSLEVSGTPQSVSGDKDAIGQVVLNLLKNASDACGEAGGHVGVQLVRTSDNVEFRVSDDGPGLSPEAQRRLFEPFFTTKPAGKGTGLGLAICRGIILDHGGRLDFSSKSGHGATFIVTLPVAASN
jgi:signal transduction histidine kinase